MTNTAGEVQLVRKGGDFMGPRSDFDILRILSHQLAQHGLGQPIRLRTPEAAFDEIRQHVPGYDVSWAGLLTGARRADARRRRLRTAIAPARASPRARSLRTTIPCSPAAA